VKELMESKGIERPSEHAARDETFKKAPESNKEARRAKSVGIVKVQNNSCKWF